MSMEPQIYFNPISADLNILQKSTTQCLGSVIRAFTEKEQFPDLEDAQIALIGVEDDRRALKTRAVAKPPTKSEVIYTSFTPTGVLSILLIWEILNPGIQWKIPILL